MSVISVEGMEFFAYHGCFKEEQIIGTRFLVDVHLEADTNEAEYNDDLKLTVNYQSVFQTVKEEMSVKSKLLEHVSRRIINRLFKDFKSIEWVSLKLSKMSPPIGGKVGSVSVSYSETRMENHKKSLPNKTTPLTEELETCPRCGKEFHCSKSGKCWCFEVALPANKLEEIEGQYEGCLCPSCMNEYASPPLPMDGKYSKKDFVYTRKKR